MTHADVQVLTEEQAQAAFEVVKAKYAMYFEPVMSDDGTRVVSQGWPEPRLVTAEGWGRDGWMVVWEEGPDDWAMQVTAGGSTEEDRALFAAASQEFGTVVKAPEPEPAAWPEGVYAEPYNSYVLALYPAYDGD